MQNFETNNCVFIGSYWCNCIFIFYFPPSNVSLLSCVDTFLMYVFLMLLCVRTIASYAHSNSCLPR